MSNILQPLITSIIETTRYVMLRDGLNEKQQRFVQNILVNAEDFYARLQVFQSAPLEEITSSMRHDLSNPLTPIFGYTQLLLTHKAGDLTFEQHDCLQRVMDDARLLNDEVERVVEEVRAALSLR